MEFDYLQSMTSGHDKNKILRDLMLAYGKDVWNFAYTFTRRADAADDITQDSFVKVFQKLDSYRGEASIKTWILAITRHVAYDYQRSAFMRKVTLVHYIYELIKGSHPSAEAEAITQVSTDEVWAHVLSLPQKFREVLVLYAHHDLSIMEISKMLGVAEGTVKSRLHRARQQIHKIYEKGEIYEG